MLLPKPLVSIPPVCECTITFPLGCRDIFCHPVKRENRNADDFNQRTRTAAAVKHNIELAGHRQRFTSKLVLIVS